MAFLPTSFLVMIAGFETISTDLTNVFEVFLPQLLLYPNPSDPLNGEAAALMMRDRTAYEQRVKGIMIHISCLYVLQKLCLLQVDEKNELELLEVLESLIRVDSIELKLIALVWFRVHWRQPLYLPR